MPKNPRLMLLASLFVLTVRTPLHAQAQAPLPDGANSEASPAPEPEGHAPDEMTKRITDLVHAGKCAEAQQLTNGLLIAYPGDQRLIKAKALIEKLLAPASSTSAASTTSPPNQSAENSNAEQLTGMDKIDYSALILLARQAQQTTDLDEQKKMLQQFMDQSAPFLQKHPDLMLLWQIRAASAISLNEPMLGYEAGQKLLAAGAVDSNDPALQQLLGQLKNKGWLDKQRAEEAERYHWILGGWSASWSFADLQSHVVATSRDMEDWEFSLSGATIEGYRINDVGARYKDPVLRGTALDSGEIHWEHRRVSTWLPVLSSEIDKKEGTMKIVFAFTDLDPATKRDREYKATYLLKKN